MGVAEDTDSFVLVAIKGCVLELELDPPQPMTKESDPSAMKTSIGKIRLRRAGKLSISSPAKLATPPALIHPRLEVPLVASFVRLTTSGEAVWSVSVEVTAPALAAVGWLKEHAIPVGSVDGQEKVSDAGASATLPVGVAVTVTVPAPLAAIVTDAGLIDTVNAPATLTDAVTAAEAV